MTLDLGIVGAGGVGLAAAWAAVKGGARVTVYEWGPLPNPSASSHDSHRLIRHAYGAEAGYARMVDAAYDSWGRLWADLGAELHVATGVLCLGAREAGYAADSARVLAEIGRPVGWRSMAALAEAFPLLRADGAEAGFHLAEGGVLLADRILAGLAGWLAGRAELRAETPVLAVDPATGRVETAAGGRRHDALLIAAGPWIGRLVPALADIVTPSRQVVAYVDPGPDLVAWTRMPMVLGGGEAIGLYVVPPVAGTGLKLGDHAFSLTGDPDGPRDAGPEEALALTELAPRLLVGAASWRLVRARACFYTVAAEERFRVWSAGRAAAVSACSGHGFKFAAVIGERIAAALLAGRDPTELGDWLAGR